MSGQQIKEGKHCDVPSIMREEGDSTLYSRSRDYVIAGRAQSIVMIPTVGKPWLITRNVSVVANILEKAREAVSLEHLLQCDHACKEIVSQIVSMLVERNVLVRSEPQTQADNAEAPLFKRLCVGVCGSIQAAAMLPYLLAFRGSVAEEVEIILTENAESFLSRKGLEAFGFRVWPTESQSNETRVQHMWLADNSDMVLVAPATGATIGRMAGGVCSDLLALVVAATRSAVVVAPSMNPKMWQYRPIQNNLRLLAEAGIYVVEPGLGQNVSSGKQQKSFSGIGLHQSSLRHSLAAIWMDHEGASRK